MAESIANHIRDISSGTDGVGNLVIKEDGTMDYVPPGQTPPVGSTAVVTGVPRSGYAASAAYPSLPSKEKLYAGMFESAALHGKVVMLIGLGSVNSKVGAELAREGCDHFIIIDHDRLEIHNLSRHVGGVADLGRLKTDIMEDYIHRKNPYAVVEKYPMNVCENREKLKELMLRADIVICGTDNNDSRYVINTEADELKKTVIYARAETRAEAVNIFIQRPGAACYNCFIAQGGHVEEEITNEASARANGTIPSYTSPEDAGVMVQIGLPSDIDPLVNMVVKLALVELTRGMEGTGIETFSEEVSAYNFFLWINHRDRKYKEIPSFAKPGSGPRILRWYGCTIPAREDCCICQE